VDLTDLVHGHRWVSLADLIFELPQASRTWGAVMNDPELAREIVAMQNRDGHLSPGDDVDDFAAEADDRPGWRPPYAEYDLHARQLGELITAVSALNQTTIASAGGKARRVEPYPEPTTALPDAQREAAARDAEAIYEQLGIRDAVPD
jgi:hypothetical protein